MGYTKIVQFGDTTEIYEYEKDIRRNNRPNFSKFIKTKNKKMDDMENSKKNIKKPPRTLRSIKKSRENFFRTVHHNNCLADTIHFVTLTFAYDLTFKEASRHVARFMERIKKNYREISINYISVPELTKKGRIHFHLLVYNLPTEIASVERKTRNLQRQFQRGYLDIVHAPYTSKGIAGYMAKYMAKSLENETLGTTRGYNCSRGIKKITSYGSNSLSSYSNLIYPQEPYTLVDQQCYDVKYLGKCIKRIIKK
jgi:hypothetical protein